MSLNSDCLLGVTGLFPDTITPREHTAAMAVPGIWEGRLKSWIRDGEQTPFEYKEPAKDFEKLLTKLATPPTENEVEGWFEGVGVDAPELQGEFFTGLTNVRAYLVNACPRFSIEGPAGPMPLPLSYDDVHEVSSLIQIADAPERILDEVASRTLTPSQALLFRENFPDLFEHANEVIDGELIKKRAHDPEYDMGWEKNAILNVLRGKPPEPMPTRPPTAPVPAKGLKIDAERTETQADVSAKPKSRK